MLIYRTSKPRRIPSCRFNPPKRRKGRFIESPFLLCCFSYSQSNQPREAVQQKQGVHLTHLAIFKSVTHRADGVGIAGVDAAVEDVCGGVGLRAAAARRALLLLLVAGGGVVAGARVELKGAQVPPANRTPIVN